MEIRDMYFCEQLRLYIPGFSSQVIEPYLQLLKVFKLKVFRAYSTQLPTVNTRSF